MCCSEFVQLRAQRVIIWKRPTRAQTILNENPLTQRVVRLLRSCPTSKRGERKRKMSDDEYFSAAFLFLLLLLSFVPPLENRRNSRADLVQVAQQGKQSGERKQQDIIRCVHFSQITQMPVSAGIFNYFLN
jgi:hypothetical protein